VICPAVNSKDRIVSARAALVVAATWPTLVLSSPEEMAELRITIVCPVDTST
jgi:hypothetical protein